MVSQIEQNKLRVINITLEYYSSIEKILNNYNKALNFFILLFLNYLNIQFQIFKLSILIKIK